MNGEAKKKNFKKKKKKMPINSKVFVVGKTEVILLHNVLAS